MSSVKGKGKVDRCPLTGTQLTSIWTQQFIGQFLESKRSIIDELLLFLILLYVMVNPQLMMSALLRFLVAQWFFVNYQVLLLGFVQRDFYRINLQSIFLAFSYIYNLKNVRYCWDVLSSSLRFHRSVSFRRFTVSRGSFGYRKRRIWNLYLFGFLNSFSYVYISFMFILIFIQRERAIPISSLFFLMLLKHLYYLY